MNTQNNKLKAIETVYDGYRFRSRLEARWAVYFNYLKIKYDYEPEGFDLGKQGYYLPDFWLPQVKMWAEVKPDELFGKEYDRCAALVRATKYPCLMLVGPPEPRAYYAIEPSGYGFKKIKPSIKKLVTMDYFLWDHHRYWETENRFYCNTGIEDEDKEETWNWFEDSPGMEAICAARQARFEHGESGLVRTQLSSR